MATKGQKFMKYKTEKKLEIIAEKKSGASYKELSMKHQIPEGTIMTWIRIYAKEGIFDVKKRGIQSDTYDSRERSEILKKNQEFL